MLEIWSCRQTTRCMLYQLYLVIAAVLAINFYIILRSTVRDGDSACSCSEAKQLNAAFDGTDTFSPRKIAFVIWDFEDFENDICDTVGNLSATKADIVIVSDHSPYPPLALPRIDNIHLVTTDARLSSSVVERRSEFYMSNASYVFLVPDGIRISGNLQHAVEFLSEVSAVDRTIAMVAFPVENTNHVCLDLNVDAKRWTLEYRAAENDTYCDAISSKEFVLLMRKETALSLPSPFLRPFGNAIFIQTAYRMLKLIIDKRRILSVHITALYKDSHNRWKHSQAEQTHLQLAYKELGFKLIKHANGRHGWYGCSRDTARCFGTVVDDMPEYIYQGRWTPPCCLRALRETAKHVFRILESDHVRYWLEGGSLLGAARNGDIILWDYDIDIGIYRDDILHCRHLSDVHRTGIAVVDTGGFVWEKATEGDFYRVQYSQTNHLHVDIFPFYSQNGTMTKSTWFKSHRQDTEFPESYIYPLGKVRFIGINVSAPNDIRKFLEYKFGIGVIENPRFPNEQAVT